MSLRKAFLFSSSCVTSLSRGGYCSSEQAKISPRDGDPNEGEAEEESDDGAWARMLPELLRVIIQNVESSQEGWPVRQDVVSCACVCRRWREVTRQIIKPPQQTGKITFPSSLKEPGPRDTPIQCFIRRNKKTSMFYLYLALNQNLVDKGKFLLVARRLRRGAHTEYIISLDAEDVSQESNAYVGKLSSDLLGTRFVIYDFQHPCSGARLSAACGSRRVAHKQVCPQVCGGSFKVGEVLYKFNILKSRGPRRMLCSLQCPLPMEMSTGNLHGCTQIPSECASLKNKSPRWHEHLQCWCLNFHGRVTVASVKNFQLVATVDPSRPGFKGDEDSVLLQFGKVADNIFTMDYREPLSAFLAFAICLTSFGTKFACE